MTIGEFFEQALRIGMDADPRGRDAAERDLAETRKSHDDLKPADRETYDRDKLANPYADSRILHGDPGHPLRKILAGIDIETPELLLADRLNAEKHHMRIVIAGHISSDSLGLNLLLDAVQKRQNFEVMECSGFTRVKRS